MSHNPSHPLRGETLFSPAPEEVQRNYQDRLIQMGASVLHIPTVELRPLEPAVGNIMEQTYGALAFSSQNAWSFFIELLEKNNLTFPESLPRFSIGPATTEAMGHLKPTAQAQTRTGKGLAEAVWNHFGTTPMTNPVLFPCSKHAHPTFAETLAELGGKSIRLEIYEPRPCKPGPIPVEVSRPSWVLLTSPSAVSGYIEHLHPIENIKVACMGLTTQAAAQAAGTHR